MDLKNLYNQKMNAVRLDISSLKKAFLSFETALVRYQANKQDLEVRDACIQRFEYTYELAVKMIKRQLENDSAIPTEIDAMNFKDKIRYAAEKNMIYVPSDWFEFREMRNLTSLTYEDSQASKVVGIFPIFQKAVLGLIQNLDKGTKT